ncbi:hypothetical protein AF332_07040 [Sporosarcina globispora]|uniref:Uncharacterized protein n=1 Tax=Sporosarcina globispora TaxID=1459 RepID=A0A0M0GAP7_SPOGL|nr:hypothetical protein [Sporosarcina globispora]KON86597.1 hypothetical protein AF332_07040 [Sporosarcina globispora]
MALGEVTEWKMTEEERLAYIAKHPIRPTKKAVKKANSAFANIRDDYNWRGKKGAEARWGTK